MILDEESLKRIARQAALKHRYTAHYLPITAEEAEKFEPHLWIKEAMQQAVKEAYQKVWDEIQEGYNTGRIIRRDRDGRIVFKMV